MLSPLPTDPAWYADPDDPARIRYWDGRAWTSEWRPRPTWVGGSADLEVSEQDFALAMLEGPAHFQEMEAPAASGGSLLHRLPWVRSGAPVPPWRPGHHPRRPSPRAVAPEDEAVVIGLGQARRPVLFFASLAFIAVGLLLLTVIVTRPTSSLSLAPPPHSFVSTANADCTQVLPHVYTSISSVSDGPQIVAAADKVDDLGAQLAAISSGPTLHLHSWFSLWHQYAMDKRRFGSLIGPAVWSQGHLSPRRLPHNVQRDAQSLWAQASQAGTQADTMAEGVGLNQCVLVAPATSTVSS
jgi:hypothetical protein